MVSKPERILRDGRRTAAASSTGTPVENLPIIFQCLKDALEEVGAPITRAEGAETLNSLTGKPVSEELPTSKNWSTLSHSSARLEDRVRDQIERTSAPLKDAVDRLFGDAAREGKSCPDTEMMAVILTVVDRSVTMAFERYTFQAVVERAAQNCLAERKITDNVTTRTADLPAFTVPVANVCEEEGCEVLIRNH